MKIVIAGAGAVGSHLAALLSREDQDIILIDENPEKTARLLNSNDLDLMTLNVSPTSIGGLKEGGVHQCDLFIAVTPEETRNITCCMLAHTLGARKTIARVDTAEYTMPQYSALFQQMGVNSIIYPEGLAAKEILDGIKRSWVRQYWEVAGGALVMLGVKLRDRTRVTGIALRDLCNDQTPYRIVAIKRGDDTIIPTGNDELRNGDIAYFMTTKRYIQYIREIVGKEDYEDVRNVMIMGGGRTSVHVAEDKPDFYNMKISSRTKNAAVVSMISSRIVTSASYRVTDATRHCYLRKASPTCRPSVPSLPRRRPTSWLALPPSAWECARPLHWSITQTISLWRRSSI